MKLRETFQIVDTEEEARAFVDAENAKHPRRKHRAEYTTWKDRFIVWYYV